MKDPIGSAIQVLRIIELENGRYTQLNKTAWEVQGDRAITLFPMSVTVENGVVAFLDAVLGADLASYYLYEASNMPKGGGITESDGSEWPIKTTADVEAYARYIAQPKAGEA